jgi:hypothetical protein
LCENKILTLKLSYFKILMLDVAIEDLEGSAPLIPKALIGKDQEPVPSTSCLQNLSPKCPS